MSAGRLQRAELVQLGAAGLVGISLLLPWYATESTGSVRGDHGGVIGWVAHPVLRWVMLAGVCAALLSAWQTITETAPTNGFERGEISSVVALTGVAIVVFQGWIERPGDPPGLVDLTYGWFVALTGTLAALCAAVARLPESKRTPPGV